MLLFSLIGLYTFCISFMSYQLGYKAALKEVSTENFYNSIGR